MGTVPGLPESVIDLFPIILAPFLISAASQLCNRFPILARGLARRPPPAL